MTPKSWAVFFVIALALLAADQWTKAVASDNLASTRWGHFLEIESETDQTVENVLATRLHRNSAEERKLIARRYVIDKDNRRLAPGTRVKAGESIFVRQRKITVIPGYFDFSYTRNKGAAFGMLQDADPLYRSALFAFVTILGIIFYILIIRGVGATQPVLLTAIAMLMGGTLGNAVDRIWHGYVIDFISWKYTDAHKWPTFNIADSAIVCGFALVVIVIIQETIRGRRQAREYADEEE